MKKRILMLGAGFMQGVAIRCAKERGWDVVAVDGNPGAVCAPLADRFEPIDLKDKEALASLAKTLMGEGGLDGVFTAATDFSASVAWVAAECGLSGHSYDAALNASDKIRMRTCFDRAGLPSPAFIGVDKDTRNSVAALLDEKNISFPVVVKPVDNMGARGCRKADSIAQLEEAIDDAIKYSRNGNVIVEEYMDGPEFSVEALVFDGEIRMTGIADRHIFFPPYFIEMGHTIPTGYSDNDMEELISVFKKGVHALGLTHGAAKGDIKLTKTGPMIGEIAGRLSGGYMSGWTFPYSSGIDLTGAALELATGIRPASLVPLKNWTSAERAWISIPGTVKSLAGIEQALAIPYVREVFPRSFPGDTVTFPVNNVEKCGNCLSAAPTRSQAVKAAEDACRNVFLRLEAGNPATDAFLASGSPSSPCFPPDAFTLPVKADFINFEAIAVSFSIARGNSVKVILQLPSFLVPFLDSVYDWQGRTLRDALAGSVEIEPRLLDFLQNDDRNFLVAAYKALLRGGIQGIVYLYDCANS